MTAAAGSRSPPAAAPAAAPQTLVDLFERSVAAHGARPLFVTAAGMSSSVQSTPLPLVITVP